MAENRVPAGALQQFLSGLFGAAGLRDKDARDCAEVFVLQEMRGVTSHGLSRVKQNVDGLRTGRLNPRPERTILREDTSMVVLDGDNGPGILGCIDAMDRAIAKAGTTGAGIAVVRNSNHFVAAAPYCLRAVEHGAIGIACSNSNASMAYPGTAEAALGNGPLGYAMPSDAGFPLVYDAAMTAAGGKLVEWAREGRRIPDALAGLDAEGNVTTDPSAVLQGGATLPIGLHKGAGLVLLIEVLTGVLAGGGFLHGLAPAEQRDLRMQRHSQCCIAIDIEHFMPLSEFRARTAAYVRDLKQHPPASDGDEIVLPGERAHRCVEDCHRLGVPLRREIETELRGLAEQWGVPFDL